MRAFIGTLKSYFARMWAWLAFMVTLSVLFGSLASLTVPALFAKIVADLIVFVVLVEIIDRVLGESKLGEDIANGREYAARHGLWNTFDNAGSTNVVLTVRGAV